MMTTTTTMINSTADKKNTTANADDEDDDSANLTPSSTLPSRPLQQHQQHDRQQKQQDIIGTLPPLTSQLLSSPQSSPSSFTTFFRMEHLIDSSQKNKNSKHNDSGSSSFPRDTRTPSDDDNSDKIRMMMMDPHNCQPTATATTAAYRSNNGNKRRRRIITSDPLHGLDVHHDLLEEEEEKDDIHSEESLMGRDQRHCERDHQNDSDDGKGYIGDVPVPVPVGGEWEKQADGERMQQERIVIFASSSTETSADTETPAAAATTTTATASTTVSGNGTTSKNSPRRSRPIGKIVFLTKTKTIMTPAASSSSSSSSSSRSSPDSQSIHSQPQPQADSHRHHHRVEVHVEVISLFVRREFRGRKLGTILFEEMVNMLRRRYGSDTTGIPSRNTTIHVTLDAEEDVRCHNRLVDFYRDLGCTVTSTKNSISSADKTTHPGGDFGHGNDTTNQENHSHNQQIVYNSTGDESYRRVPMEFHIDLSDSDGREHDRHLHVEGVTSNTNYRSTPTSAPPCQNLISHDQPPSLIENGTSLSFIPVTFLSSTLDSNSIPTVLRKTNTSFVHRDPIKTPTADAPHHINIPDTKGSGHGQRSRNNRQWLMVYDNDHEEVRLQLHCWTSCTSDDEERLSHRRINSFRLIRRSQHQHHHQQREHDYRNVLVIQSSCRLYYLGMPPNYEGFVLTTNPFDWEFDNKRSTFVPSIHAAGSTESIGLLPYSHASMTLEDALLHAKNVPATFSHAMSSNNSNNDVSLRMFCFQLAELARDAGHPDWFQFTAMICCLGSILMRTDEGAEKNNGPSYMLEILKNSSVGLPEESFDLLRSFSLLVGDCSNGNASVHNTKSEDNQSWMDYPRPVLDLYEIIDFAQRQTIHHPTSQRQATSESQGTAATTAVVVSESHCDELWEEYYSYVAMKYDAMKYLKWQ